MSEFPHKKKALGRGLSALLEGSDNETAPKDLTGEYPGEFVTRIRIDQIETNPFQPRSRFDESELDDLAASIREHGIIQPLTLRSIGPQKYQLISGERRLRASVLAGLTHVPAYVRLANDEQMLEMALVENIQREDLNPIEIAISFQRLLDECRIRQEDLSGRVGKDRTTISNYIRLLRLPGEIQVAVRDNMITMGHARALVSVEDEKTQLLILKKILENKLSVRQVEELVRTAGKPSASQPARTELPVRFEKARQMMHEKLRTGVDVKLTRKGSGSITISFRNGDDFDRIVSKLES